MAQRNARGQRALHIVEGSAVHRDCSLTAHSATPPESWRSGLGQPALRTSQAWDLYEARMRLLVLRTLADSGRHMGLPSIHLVVRRSEPNSQARRGGRRHETRRSSTQTLPSLLEPIVTDGPERRVYGYHGTKREAQAPEGWQGQSDRQH